jgi:hypothetical protein
VGTLADIVMKTINLKEFIKTGKFGTISIGSTKADIIDLLGPKFEPHHAEETQIIKYGWYEFFYWTKTETVFGIQNDHLLADCTNHKEMITIENANCIIDTWFLQENKNVSFGQVEDFLHKEKIPFQIVPSYKGSIWNVIECIESKVTFDFADEYRLVELNEKGKFIGWTEHIETDQSNFLLNGIRLFER